MPVQSSKLWTLRLKNGKRTILVFADPAQSQLSLKTTLLACLKSAPESSPSPTAGPIPSSPSDIEIGKPNDLFDLSKGFALLGADGEDINEAEGQSIRSLGVKENYVLAYRFKGSGGEDDETMDDDPGWDVEIASFEDIYGVENRGDLGAVPEYRG